MTHPVTSTEPPETQAPEHIAVFAQNVLDYLVANERSVAWLARRLSLHPNSLTYNLRNPRSLSLEVALRIEASIGVTIDRAAAA